MLGNLKNFLRHSAVYSISNAAAKAMGVILLPLYTSYLSLADFGELAIIEVTLVICVELFALGQGPSIVMFNDSDEFKESIKSIYFTVYSFSLAVAAGSALLLYGIVFGIHHYVLDIHLIYTHFPVIAAIFVARILHGLCLDKIRAEEKSVLYTSINLARLLLTLCFTIFFVAYMEYRVPGVLYGYLIGDGVIAIYVSLHQFKGMAARIRKDIIPVSLKFGVPLIFTSVAFMILNVSDRYFIKYFHDSEQVALYDLGYRVAGVLNMFIIMPFTLTLMPSAYKMYGKPGDTRYYSKLLTYFTFALMWAGLALSLFAKELLMIFALNKDYWPAYTVVPLVILGYIFSGMRIFAVLGQFLTRNLKEVASTSLGAAILNIVLNFIFIPKYGMMAAAYTTLASFFILYIVSLFISRKYYTIPFEHGKVSLLIVLGTVMYILFAWLGPEDLVNGIIIKIILLAVFPFLLYPLGFYEKIELDTMKKLIKNPADLKKLFEKSP